MKIFNVILKTGIYPKSWKESFTIPIYKSGDKNDPNNYRGISLINCLPKICNIVESDSALYIMSSSIVFNWFSISFLKLELK
jgi:hypothetical protein